MMTERLPYTRRSGRSLGFTLIELLIVVAIIGILAAIAIPNFQNARFRATIAKVQGDMRALINAVEMYSVDHGKYPDDGQVTGIPWWMNNWHLTTPIAYIGSIPADPFVVASPHEITPNPRDEYWYTSWDGYGLYRNPGRAKSVAGRENVRLYDPPRDNFKYAFISPGPDSCWEWDRGNGMAGCSDNYMGDVFYYDMSNGIRSQGDLYQYGPGNVYNPPANF